MLRYMIVASVITVPLVLSSCAFKEYDPQHPQEYSNYWNDEEHLKGSPAYPFTSGSGDRRGPYGP